MFISGEDELTTQLSKPVRILWLPKCRMNKLGYLAREDYLDPLQLRVIKYCFLVGPLDAPLCLYLPLGVETPKMDLIFANTSLFRRRRRFKIGAAWRSCSGTLPEGDTPSGRPSNVHGRLPYVP